MISQTTEYALRAVVHLATRSGAGPISALEIADATKVPVGYLQKILRVLSKAEILTAQRGSGGGFALAKVPSSIRVLDILQATDSTLTRIQRCPLGIEGHMKLCSLHRMIDEEIAHAEKKFATTSIADLIAENQDCSPLCGQPDRPNAELRIKGDSENV